MDPAPDTRPRRACGPLAETAWRYRAGEGQPEDLPMIAAEAIAAGMDTPALCELAGLPRNADASEIRDLLSRRLPKSASNCPHPSWHSGTRCVGWR